jgi:hypothetical protein
MALEEYTPLTEAELAEMEQRARGPKGWPSAEVLRLITEIRRLREALEQSEEGKPIWEEIVELMQDVPDEEWAKLPTDGSENLDHYLYGAPKR